MDTNTLIAEVAQHYNSAAAAWNADNERDALSHLAELRAFLNDQPELEAGGAAEELPPAEPGPE